MKPVFPKPKQETLFKFIVESTSIEGEPISTSEVLATFEKKALHPSAAGHFSAINLIIKLASNQDFPTKHPSQYESIQKSDVSLYWLRDIHKKLMTPTAEWGTAYANPDAIKLADCGNYRLTNREMASFDRRTGEAEHRPLPKPTDIKQLLHEWHQRLAEFHKNISAVLRRPSHNDLINIENSARKFHIQLQCIHPWTDGTGRTARLVENLLRLRWGLPWRNCNAERKLEYIKEIMKYEDGEEWQNLLNNK